MMKTTLQPILRAALLLIVVFASTFSAIAKIFKVDGIYYKTTDAGCVAVTKYGSGNNYSGKVNIPSTVTYSMIRYNVTSIGECAFLECADLTSVIIPNSVKTIDRGAFSQCTGLTSMTIPNSVTTINENAFIYCTGLSSIIIPSSVTYIDKSTFYGCTGLTSIQVAAGNEVYDSRDNCNAIIEKKTNKLILGCKTSVIPNSVTSIGDCAFRSCAGLTDVIIPNSVTSIGNYVFQSCEDLTGVSIGNSVTTIGDDAFQNCTGLMDVILPNSVTSLGVSAFSDCSRLASLTISNSVTFINKSTFRRCKGLTKVTIPNSVTTIDEFAFSECSGLTSMTIGNSVTSIGNSAFNGCNGLIDVTIPNSVKSIGNSAFKNCTGLKSMTIGKSVSFIADNAFENLFSLASITVDIDNKSFDSRNGCNAIIKTSDDALILGCKNTIIPNTVQIIGKKSFYMCHGLTELEFPNSVSVIQDYAFSYCENLNNIVLPKSLYSIGIDSFYGCSSLSTLTIPVSVHYIYSYAFRNCESLQELSFDSPFIKIDSEAFRGTALKKVVCRTSNPPKMMTQTVFSDYVYNTAILYVPVGSEHNYQTTDWWNKFNSIIGENFADVSGIGPTSINISNHNSESGNVCYEYNNVTYQTLVLTGLEPSKEYDNIYIVLDDYKRTNLDFTTLALSMTAKTADMITNRDARLMAETNMADEETSCGFEWRRYDAPEEMPSTKVYCPVYGGTMAGTLKNLSENVYYKYRPFYKSSKGNEYYGDWIAFITADAGVEFEPVVYTYSSPEVSQTEATLQGVALRGSDDITEQGFEYWQAGRNNMLTASNVKKVTAKGERMSATVTGLQPGTAYKFRAYAIAGGKTTRGAEVDFVTESTGLDVNADGIVNIADMNVVINVILRGNNDRTCDVNGDGLVNISDLNAIISSILAN